MLAEVWLRIEGKKKYGSWGPGHVTASKTKPSTRDNEVAVKLDIAIPDEIFEEPVFEARLTLPKSTRQLPEMTEIASSVGEAMSKQLGFRVKISMSDPAENNVD